MIISLHKYLYFSTEIHPRLLLVAIFKYPDNTQERSIKPKKVTLSLNNVFLTWFVCDYICGVQLTLFSLVTTLPRSHGKPRLRWQVFWANGLPPDGGQTSEHLELIVSV